MTVEVLELKSVRTGGTERKMIVQLANSKLET